MGIGGPELTIHFQVSTLLLEVEGLCECVRCLLTDGSDDLVAGQHPFAALDRRGPAATVGPGLTEGYAHAPQSGHPTPLSVHLYGLVEDIDMSGGTVSAPTQPGLGYEIDWELVKRKHVATLE